MTNIGLLPIITVAANTARDGDVLLSVGIQNNATAVDISGIAFGMRWKRNASDTTIVFDAAVEQALTNTGVSGVVILAIPKARAARITAGNYVADLFAVADGNTIVIGTWSITHADMGACQITSLTTTSRNAATANSVGYVPGPQGDVTPAAAAALAAAVAAASAADASATNAQGSARAAVSAAVASSNSAGASAASATNAAGSAATATSQAVNAGASATAASVSASSALTSATTAETKATDATSSVTNAANSATAAAGSATAAANSATGAAASKSATDTNAAATAADRTAVRSDRQATDTSAALVASALAGANGAPASPYWMDGLPWGAVFSAPKGAFLLNGVAVPLSSLLTFSTAQKYTVGPDGNYILNAANAPAWDWSTGRKRLLIEPRASTNYWLNSEDGTTWGGSNNNNISTLVTANALLGILAETTVTATSASAPEIDSTSIPITLGQNIVVTHSLRAGTKSTLGVMMYGTTSGPYLSTKVVPTILSGPGTITAVTAFGTLALYQIANLSATVPTMIAWAVTGAASETFFIRHFVTSYYGYNGPLVAVGDSFKIGRPSIEYGSAPSSYIPCGASATTRAADVVPLASGLLALLNSGTASFAIRGTVLMPNLTTTSVIARQNGFARVMHYPGAGYDLIPDRNYANVLGPVPADLGPNFGIAMSYTPGQRSASAGGAVVKDNGSFFNPTDTSILIGDPGYSPGNLLLDELVVWPFVGSDAGIQAQARAYQ